MIHHHELPFRLPFDNVTFNIDVPAYADVARIFSLTNDEVSAVGQTVRWVQFSASWRLWQSLP